MWFHLQPHTCIGTSFLGYKVLNELEWWKRGEGSWVSRLNSLLWTFPTTIQHRRRWGWVAKRSTHPSPLHWVSDQERDWNPASSRCIWQTALHTIVAQIVQVSIGWRAGGFQPSVVESSSPSSFRITDKPVWMPTLPQCPNNSKLIVKASIRPPLTLWHKLYTTFSPTTIH